MIPSLKYILITTPFFICLSLLCIYLINNIDETDKYKDVKHILYAILAIFSIIMIGNNVTYILILTLQRNQSSSPVNLDDIPFFVPSIMRSPNVITPPRLLPLTPSEGIRSANI